MISNLIRDVIHCVYHLLLLAAFAVFDIYSHMIFSVFTCL